VRWEGWSSISSTEVSRTRYKTVFHLISTVLANGEILRFMR
jgi:hypothetical protein